MNVNEVLMAPGRSNEPDPVRTLADALSTLQRNSGRPLRSLEPEIHVSDSSLSRYLRGHSVPPWDVVRALCVALKADPVEYRARWEAANAIQSRAVQEKPDVAPSRKASRTEWRWAATGGGVGAVLGSLVTLAVIPAPTSGESDPAGPLPITTSGRIFVSRATGACLDHSMEGGLRTFPCNGMSYQRWTVRPFGEGTYRISNHATGACLDRGATGLRSAECAETASQQWMVTVSDAAAEVRRADDDECLHDDEVGLRLIACDGGSRKQRWG
ncbi:Helix-turn-helix domain-containing protein [Lentzea fradiae]|uniref:Helix-turn-helix domain-containing protein n=1 Tax=Lentzea fradiae TaxID=200378 RepID=A0A1G7KFS2_9PSEU|nr:ricin-type beta-trefoil lectin domain protein [Lentzea fradiae]SDF36005.1 Helix-turn-helix domain-containing protein [Lentzea fradiae]